MRAGGEQHHHELVGGLLQAPLVGISTGIVLTELVQRIAQQQQRVQATAALGDRCRRQPLHQLKVWRLTGQPGRSHQPEWIGYDAGIQLEHHARHVIVDGAGHHVTQPDEVLAQQALPRQPADRLADHFGVDRMRQPNSFGSVLGGQRGVAGLDGDVARPVEALGRAE